MATLTPDKRKTLEKTIVALKKADGNRTAAAKALGISHGTIHNRVNDALDAGLDVPPAPHKGAKRKAKAKPVGPIRFRTPDEKRNGWREYVAGGRRDDLLRNELIEADMPALHGLANKTRAALAGQVDEGDLLSEGAMALIQCAKTFDPERCAFWTYAARRALGQMLDHAREMDPVSRVCRNRSKSRLAFEEAFATKQGRRPNDEEILAGLKWSEVELASSYPKGSISSDSLRFEFDESGTPVTIGDLLASCEDPPESNEISEDFFRDVTRGLPYDQQTMLFLYFVRGASMKNIGLALGLSESRISQQITQAKAMLLERIRRERAE